MAGRFLQKAAVFTDLEIVSQKQAKTYRETADNLKFEERIKIKDQDTDTDTDTDTDKTECELEQFLAPILLWVLRIGLKYYVRYYYKTSIWTCWATSPSTLDITSIHKAWNH